MRCAVVLIVETSFECVGLVGKVFPVLYFSNDGVEKSLHKPEF